jgi:acetolactate synthase-1/2/3 large subunit
MNSSDLSSAIATALAQAGADTVFGMPGGGNNLDFIGATEAAGLRFVLAHAETSAAIMAAAYGDLTESPGVCVVTRGPGAASAVNGVANALLDRQQLVCVTDAVGAADCERIAHQRIDQRALYAPITKWSATVGAGDTSGTAEHAVATAMAFPRGPVHLDYDPSAQSTAVPTVARAPSTSATDLSQVAELVEGAQRPVVLLGVGARGLTSQVRALLADSPAPVLMTYRAKGLVPDSWPSNAGLLSGATTEAPILAAADLVVMIGVDTVEFIPNLWPYVAPVVSLASWSESSPYLPIRVEVVGDLGKLVTDLAQHWPTTTWDPAAGSQHRDLELQRLVGAAPDDPDGIVPQDLVLRTRHAAPAGTVATVDAGAHMLPSMSLWSVENVDEVLISSGLATMGFALPAAIGAALARPEQRIVCFTGDGGLGMCLGELETVFRLGLRITIVLFNDARLSLIAIKAKPEGNGGDNAIGYAGTDFAAVAAGYGLASANVSTLDELDAALDRSFDHDGPTLLDVRVDPSHYLDVLGVIRGKR